MNSLTGGRTLYAVYAPLGQCCVGEGQSVKEGAVLGYSGTDGNAAGTPPHLRLEILTIKDPPPHFRVPRGQS